MSKIESEFSYALTKIAKDSSKSYLSQMAIFAPAAAIQAVAEVPKGIIDKGIQNKVVKGTFNTAKSKVKDISSGPSPLRVGMGRGAGRLGAALVSTPLFVGGIKQLAGAKTPKQKKEGFTKIVAAGGVYAGLKGLGEGAISYGSPFKRNKLGKLTPGAKKSLSKIKGLVSTRGAIGIGSAALTAYGIANNLKNSKGKKGFYNDIVAPAMLGAGIGFAKGGIETAIVDKTLKGRKLLGGGLGRAASGAIGALVLDKVVKNFTKKASSKPLQIVKAIKDNSPGLSPAYIYSDTMRWAKDHDTKDIRTAFLRMNQEGPEKTPTRRAQYYALYNTLKHRGENPPKPELIDKVKKLELSNAGKGIGILAASVTPNILELALKGMPRGQHDALLEDALDNMITSKGHNRISYKASSILDGSSYHPAEKLIRTRVGADSATIAHELGHISNNSIRKELLQSAGSVKAYRAGRVLSYLIPVTALALASEDSFATDKELQAKANLVKSVGNIAAIGMAPIIAEEGLANLKGLHHMRTAAKKTGVPVNKATMNYILRQGPKMLGYMAPLLAPMLTAKYFESKKRG